MEVILIAFPAISMFGFTVYMKHIHDGATKQHAIAIGWSYAILAAGFFALIFLVKYSFTTPLT